MKLVLKNIALQLLHGYRFAVSPSLGSACRYQPTCSAYAMHAIELHGCVRGGWMAVGRILRCHPFGGSGYDPVHTKNSDPAPRFERTALDRVINH